MNRSKLFHYYILQEMRESLHEGWNKWRFKIRDPRVKGRACTLGSWFPSSGGRGGRGGRKKPPPRTEPSRQSCTGRHWRPRRVRVSMVTTVSSRFPRVFSSLDRRIGFDGLVILEFSSNMKRQKQQVCARTHARQVHVKEHVAGFSFFLFLNDPWKLAYTTCLFERSTKKAV